MSESFALLVHYRYHEIHYGYCSESRQRVVEREVEEFVERMGIIKGEDLARKTERTDILAGEN